MTAAADRRGRRGLLLALVATCIAYSFVQAVLNPALPAIARDFEVPPGQVTWLVAANLLAGAVVTPLFGSLGDRLDARLILLACVALVVVGSVLCAVAPNFATIVVGRVVQSGGNGVFPVCFIVARRQMPLAALPRAVGILSSRVALGGGIGVVLGGYISDWVGYRWIFWISAAYGAVVIVWILRAVDRVPPGQGPVAHVPSALLLSAWLSMITLALSWAPTRGWFSPAVAALGAAGLVVLLLWVWVEWRVRNPLLELRILLIRTVWVVDVAGMAVAAGMYVCFGIVPLLAQTPSGAGYGVDVSAAVAGLLLLPLTVGVVVGGALANRLVDRVGSRVVLAVSTTACGLSLGLLAFWHDSLVSLAVALGLQGLGLGSAFAAMMRVLVAAVPHERTGAATGLHATLRVMGGAAAVAWAAGVLSAGENSLHVPSESGYVLVFLVMGGLDVAVALLALGASRLGRHCVPPPPEVSRTAGGQPAPPA
ncbi:MFS transporter [Dactylosporangium sucinum]|uniref:MFS transporter n=1 Tax=Dactylosporangium sucinum TaxID=1424081 RepID=A0A917X379_9ACTN|nr:MFS transporter [Dactylosporangium sucinum]GGM64641.1 MFS transporter [Dactylosporangium sucinum]